MKKINHYHNVNWSIDVRSYPQFYKRGKGEFGVLLYQPYKNEILPHWRFKTVKEAYLSAAKIYDLFLHYIRQKDYIGADMARKYLQMGYTRAMRYAKYKGGKKKDQEPLIWADDEKRKSALIFRDYLNKVKENETYKNIHFPI